MKDLPSGLTASAATGLPWAAVRTALPLSALSTRTTPSVPDASNWAGGKVASRVMGPVPAITGPGSTLPPAASGSFQVRMLLSPCAVATRLPSGRMATAATSLVAVISAKTVPSARFQTRAVLSAPETSRAEFVEKPSAFTGLVWPERVLPGVSAGRLQSLMSLPLAAASHLPSGLVARSSAAPGRVCFCTLVGRCQSFTSRKLPEASVLPSGLNASA